MKTKECAMLRCPEPAAEPPLVAELPEVGAFEIPLCPHCRDPFEEGFASLFDLVFAGASIAA